MKILIFNAGSTSIKYKLFALPKLKVIYEGKIENIKNYDEAVKSSLRKIGDLRDLKAIGHRVVHGGTEYQQTTKINSEVLNHLDQYSILAPLHNPPNLAVIRACQKYLPNLDHYACFDTMFFNQLPPKARIYPLPLELAQKEKVEHFGFQGLSHQYATQVAAQKLKKPPSQNKLITVHLGGGCSITAIQQGRAIDTTMGFTPLAGIMMLTRPGDLDPGIILHLLKKYSREELDQILNHKSGIFGISGYNNYLQFIKAVEHGKKNACLAFEIFIYSIQKSIGAYYAILNGIDALVFTGQIGSGKSITRKTICTGLKKILQGVKIYTIHTDEEKIIAQQINQLINI